VSFRRRPVGRGEVGGSDLPGEQGLGERRAERLGVHRGKTVAADVTCDGRDRRRTGRGHDCERRVGSASPRAPRRTGVGHVEHGALEVVLREREDEHPRELAAVGVDRAYREVSLGPRCERHPEVVVDIGGHSQKR
jgi:hypothetical protein